MKTPSVPLKIPIYINNGTGRDTYISFYNGGLGHYKYSRSYKKDYFQIPIYKYHPDLYKRRPIDRYQISGEGREYFIYKGIQSEHDKITDNTSFERTLRKDDSPREYQLSYKRPRNKFERRLVNRIFYGRCPGMKDRQMSPKVKFKKDIEREKQKELEESSNNKNFMTITNSEATYENNESGLKTERNRIINHLSLGNTFMNANRGNEDGNLYNTLTSRSRKKTITRNNNPNTIQSDDLISSVRKIFLFNSKYKIKNEAK